MIADGERPVGLAAGRIAESSRYGHRRFSDEAPALTWDGPRSGAHGNTEVQIRGTRVPPLPVGGARELMEWEVEADKLWSFTSYADLWS